MLTQMLVNPKDHDEGLETLNHTWPEGINSKNQVNVSEKSWSMIVKSFVKLRATSIN